MPLLLPSVLNIVTLFLLFLVHAPVVVGLPTSRETSTAQPGADAAVGQTGHGLIKRAIDSSAVGGIAGGAIGLILLALIIGLGAASIAVLGSLEWREWRGKKEEGKGEGEGEGEGEKKAEEGMAHQRTPSTQTDDSVLREKEKALPARSTNRKTLMSFIALDFKSGWIPRSNK